MKQVLLLLVFFFTYTSAFGQKSPYEKLSSEIQPQDLKNDIDDLDDYCLEKFESLVKQIKTLETNNQLLSNKIATLEKFNSRLEKTEIGLRKKNIGELLNDKFKN